MRKPLLLVCCLLFLFGCNESEYEVAQDKIGKQMGWLYSASPEKDVQAALGKKDYRFIGVYGYKPYVPDVPLKCISPDKDVKFIEGTSDAVLGYEHAKLIAIAGAYAHYYNLQMRMYLEKHKGFKCDS